MGSLGKFKKSYVIYSMEIEAIKSIFIDFKVAINAFKCANLEESAIVPEFYSRLFRE